MPYITGDISKFFDEATKYILMMDITDPNVRFQYFKLYVDSCLKHLSIPKQAPREQIDPNGGIVVPNGNPPTENDHAKRLWEEMQKAQKTQRTLPWDNPMVYLQMGGQPKHEFNWVEAQLNLMNEIVNG